MLNLGSDSNRPLILEKTFMAPVGAVVDIVKNMISFANIYENIYYKVIPANRGDKT